MNTARVVRIQSSRLKSPGLHVRRWLALSLVVLAVLISPEGFCSRLPGMGLREGVTDWHAYVVASDGTTTKINAQLEVVQTQVPFSPEDIPYENSRIVSAALSCDERWLFIGGYRWPAGYFSAISTTDLQHLQGPFGKFEYGRLPDTEEQNPPYPLARFPDSETTLTHRVRHLFGEDITIVREHAVGAIAPVSERFVFVQDEAYRSGPSGMCLRIDTHHSAAIFLPDRINILDGGLKTFRISPDRKHFVVLDNENVARLFRTADGRLIKESALPAFRFVSPDEAYPDRVYVYGYDVDWQTEQLDVWWTQWTPERPLQRVLITLGENEARVQETSDSPWPDEAFYTDPELISDPSLRKVYQLYFRYLDFDDDGFYKSSCLTVEEARLFSEVFKEPGRFSSMPDQILATFLSPDGRYFFCEASRPIGEDSEGFICVIDVETGKVVLTREQPDGVGVVGIYFDSGGTRPSLQK